MERRKHVELLLRKAAQDEYVLDLLLADEGGPVEPFGFHAQQAVEKLLKAAIRAAGAEYPNSHRLGDLLDIARTSGANVPQEFEALRLLTPFAVEFRYDVYPASSQLALDSTETREAIRRPREWVHDLAGI